MTVGELLAEAEAAGATLMPRLWLTGADRISAELRQRLRDAERDVIRHLLAEPPDKVPISQPSEPAAWHAPEAMDRDTLIALTDELAVLLARTPGQRIGDPTFGASLRAAAYFRAEATRRLLAVAHDSRAAEELMEFWRRARSGASL